jgi:hypothetical protein
MEEAMGEFSRMTHYLYYIGLRMTCPLSMHRVIAVS